MNIKRPEIILDSVQFKSLDACRKTAKGLQLIEEYSGIHSVRVTVKTPFLCPDIDLEKLDRTPTERILRDILLDLK